jgi:copper chaperone
MVSIPHGGILVRDKASNTMNTTTTSFTVTGMTCGHCVAAVTEEVSKLKDVKRVAVDLASGEVTVESDGPIDPIAFAAAVDEAGYEVAP